MIDSAPPADPNVAGSAFFFIMNIKTSDLVQLGQTAADAFNEHDNAQTALEESFGTVFNVAKDNLLRDVRLAETQGLDLSMFSGESSRFKFPQFDTNIVVRIQRIPTRHAKLEKLAQKVAKLEQELKVAKLQLKHLGVELVHAGECDEVTDKVTLAFTRMRK